MKTFLVTSNLAKQMNKTRFSKFIAGVLVVGFGLFGVINCNSSNTYDTNEYTQPATPKTEWFRGGTLHNASVSEWKGGTYANKLATAGDWLSATSWKGHLTRLEDFDNLKIIAAKLVNGLDKVVAATKDADPIKMNELAAFFITQSNDLGPDSIR